MGNNHKSPNSVNRFSELGSPSLLRAQRKEPRLAHTLIGPNEPETKERALQYWVRIVTYENHEKKKFLNVKSVVNRTNKHCHLLRAAILCFSLSVCLSTSFKTHLFRCQVLNKYKEESTCDESTKRY